jgi:hypothetical protein
MIWHIRATPPSGNSCAKRRISPRISAVIFGRPPRARKRQCQKSRKPARRQLMTVSGFTMTRTSAQRGRQRRKTAQKNLSSRFEMGRARLRFSTVTCLSEGEDFKSRITPTAKKKECGKECED